MHDLSALFLDFDNVVEPETQGCCTRIGSVIRVLICASMEKLQDRLCSLVTLLDRDIDLTTVTDRMAVKRAVESGNVEEAIEKLKVLNPEILETNRQLFFRLQQQRMIELIKNGKIKEAMDFGKEVLAPMCEANQSFLKELERTVSLLVFENVADKPHLRELLDISCCLNIANELNAAILTSQGLSKDAKVLTLLKMFVFSQFQLWHLAIYPVMYAPLQEFQIPFVFIHPGTDFLLDHAVVGILITYQIRRKLSEDTQTSNRKWTGTAETSRAYMDTYIDVTGRLHPLNFQLLHF
ncbi:GID8-like protein [Drosera capensis]